MADQAEGATQGAAQEFRGWRLSQPMVYIDMGCFSNHREPHDDLGVPPFQEATICTVYTRVFSYICVCVYIYLCVQQHPCIHADTFVLHVCREMNETYIRYVCSSYVYKDIHIHIITYMYIESMCIARQQGSIALVSNGSHNSGHGGPSVILSVPEPGDIAFPESVQNARRRSPSLKIATAN